MRNFNEEFQDNEERKYAYDFDYIVRRYMMRMLEPYFTGGKALELGCFEGEATKLYAERFDDLTVLEASDELIAVAKSKVAENVEFIHSMIETAALAPAYDQIFLVHTLEHLDDPVAALARIGEWLSPNGRLFVVVPNADAASRQIAVKMGLIESNNAITPGEADHGHRNTYSFDTLERDVRNAGLAVQTRGGIVFKPFANFQFDLALKHGIIDEAYLEGCYAFGMQHPELCASIYIVCGRAKPATPSAG